MNIIELTFDKTITGLAGNPYGYKEYLNQVDEKFNWTGKNKIVFPSHIEKVGISFIQGFSKEILKKISKSEVEKYIIIESATKELTKKIMDNIKF